MRKDVPEDPEVMDLVAGWMGGRLSAMVDRQEQISIRGRMYPADPDRHLDLEAEALLVQLGVLRRRVLREG